MADNTVTLVGNVTRDPELRYTSGGRGVASFGLAVNRRYQVNGEWQEQTSFFNVVAWGTLGENAAACINKGTRLVVVRSPRAALVGDPGGREAHRRRGHRRRARPEPALGPGPRREDRRAPAPTAAAAAPAARRPVAAAGPPIPSTATKSRSEPRTNDEGEPLMASKKNRARASKDTAPRKYKKKTSALITEKVEYVDYKDVDLLSRFMSDRAKIRNRRVSGNDVQQQREVAGAIKIAREMALLPYAKRVSTQRTRPPRDGRPGRDRDAEARTEAEHERSRRAEVDEDATTEAED